ncbi:MAG: hypothetical protein M3083_25190 [Actinomycetota bacterium]|nr:hypothetical protein [Actinomycetota bacterium]
MTARRVYQVGAVAWAAVGVTIARGALRLGGPAVPVVVWVSSVFFPLIAVLAALALARGHDRLAGLLLVVSAATPTYFFWIVNVPALVVGGALLIRGRVSPRTARVPSGSESSGPAS